jgi:hypothetical protein
MDRKKQGRGRKTKMNEQQTIYLEDLFDEFEDKRQQDKLGKFWTKMENGFFKRWPEEATLGIVLLPPPADDPDGDPEMSWEDTVQLGAATKKRKEVGKVILTRKSSTDSLNAQQLHAWFNNKSQKVKKSQNGVANGSMAGSLVGKLFRSLKKRSRKLQEREIHQMRHKDEIEAQVKASMEHWNEGDSSNTSSSETSSSSSDCDDAKGDAQPKGNAMGNAQAQGDAPAGRFKSKAAGKGKGKAAEKRPLKNGERKSRTMALRRRIAAEMWEAADEEERAEVQRIYLAQPVINTGLDDEGGERTPEEYQQ